MRIQIYKQVNSEMLPWRKTIAQLNPCLASTSHESFMNNSLIPTPEPMRKEETLLKIREVEAESKRLREAAEKEKERILREARKQVIELSDQLRQEADEAYEEALRQAQERIEGEKERILEQARKQAAALTIEGQRSIGKAVELLASKFKGAVNA